MDEVDGSVLISPDVLTTIVRQVVEATPDVAHISGSLPGRMTRVLGGRRTGSGIDVLLEDGAVTVELYIVARPNVVLLPLGLTLQREISRSISDVVGMPVRAVNIHFDDVLAPYSE